MTFCTKERVVEVRERRQFTGRWKVLMFGKQMSVGSTRDNGTQRTLWSIFKLPFSFWKLGIFTFFFFLAMCLKWTLLNCVQYFYFSEGKGACLSAVSLWWVLEDDSSFVSSETVWRDHDTGRYWKLKVEPTEFWITILFSC